jgi:nitroreductase
MEALQFVYKRQSVRKFTDETVPEEHLREIVRAATFAPSGKNVQNWQFVAVTDKNKVTAIADIVAKKNAELAALFKDEQKAKAFRASVHYHTVFKNAPLLVLVYAGPYETVADMLIADGAMTAEEAAKYGRPSPGVQNVAAAMENLHLAAASLGYGTCWMTGPTYAAEEITASLGATIKPGYYLAAMTPLGVPAVAGGTRTPRKPLEEVLTIIR